MHVIPIEGLVGRVVGDFLIHYLNLAGAYIVCATVLAVALYLSTAFSFSSVQVWIPTRFAFAFALRDRWRDWREERAKRKMQRELEKRRASKPVVTAQLVPGRAAPVVEPRAARSQGSGSSAPVRTGIDRMMGAPEEEPSRETVAAAVTAASENSSATVPRAESGVLVPEVSERADSAQKHKTIMPRIAGGYKLPPSSLLHRPDGAQSVDADELKILAQVLTEKYAEFDVHGQVTQINPGPVVTTFEYKPEAGVKYSRITNLTEDLCLALKAESILVERMAGKSTVGIQIPNRNREQTIVLVADLTIHRLEVETDAWAGERHQWTDRSSRSRDHAAPADCRLHGHGQVGRHQCFHHVDPVQGDAGPGALDPG